MMGQVLGVVAKAAPPPVQVVVQQMYVPPAIPPPPVVWGITLKRTPPRTAEDGTGIDPCTKFFLKLFMLPLAALMFVLGCLLLVLNWCWSMFGWLFCLADYYRAYSAQRSNPNPQSQWAQLPDGCGKAMVSCYFSFDGWIHANCINALCVICPW